MFLGLDRRARLAPEDRRVYPTRIRNAERNVFSGSSAGSLSDAIDLAQTAYREARFESSRIGDQLQRDMLLNLLTFSSQDLEAFSSPTPQDIMDLERVASDLETLPTIFNLPKSEVQKRVAPFVKALQDIVAKIPQDFNIATMQKDYPRHGPPFIAELIKWSSNKSQLKRIRVISETVSAYNERRDTVMEPIKKYKELLNKFLRDSGKTVDIDDRGALYVRLRGVKETKSVSSLSSGESQIFVILTQLSFNPSARRANVFIIDEPELSLHVYWQELFVDSVISANDKIQFIMATHSPSIILDKTNNCVDISVKAKRTSSRG